MNESVPDRKKAPADSAPAEVRFDGVPDALVQAYRAATDHQAEAWSGPSTKTRESLLAAARWISNDAQKARGGATLPPMPTFVGDAGAEPPASRFGSLIERAIAHREGAAVATPPVAAPTAAAVRPPVAAVDLAAEPAPAQAQDPEPMSVPEPPPVPVPVIVQASPVEPAPPAVTATPAVADPDFDPESPFEPVPQWVLRRGVHGPGASEAALSADERRPVSSPSREPAAPAEPLFAAPPAGRQEPFLEPVAAIGESTAPESPADAFTTPENPRVAAPAVPSAAPAAAGATTEPDEPAVPVATAAIAAAAARAPESEPAESSGPIEPVLLPRSVAAPDAAMQPESVAPQEHPQAALPPPPAGVESSGGATSSQEHPQAALPPPPEGVESSGGATSTQESDEAWLLSAQIGAALHDGLDAHSRHDGLPDEPLLARSGHADTPPPELGAFDLRDPVGTPLAAGASALRPPAANRGSWMLRAGAALCVAVLAGAAGWELRNRTLDMAPGTVVAAAAPDAATGARDATAARDAAVAAALARAEAVQARIASVPAPTGGDPKVGASTSALPTAAAPPVVAATPPPVAAPTVVAAAPTGARSEPAAPAPARLAPAPTLRLAMTDAPSAKVAPPGQEAGRAAAAARAAASMPPPMVAQAISRAQAKADAFLAGAGAGTAAEPTRAPPPAEDTAPATGIVAKAQAKADAFLATGNVAAPAAAPAPAAADEARSRVAEAAPVAPPAARADIARDGATVAAPSSPGAAAGRDQLLSQPRPTVVPSGLNAAAAKPVSLQGAADAGDVGTITRLLREGGTPVDQVDASGRTALLHAVLAQHPAAVRALLAAGADPARADRTGQTPRSAAQRGGNAEISGLLDGGR